MVVLELNSHLYLKIIQEVMTDNNLMKIFPEMALMIQNLHLINIDSRLMKNLILIRIQHFRIQETISLMNRFKVHLMKNNLYFHRNKVQDKEDKTPKIKMMMMTKENHLSKIMRKKFKLEKLNPILGRNGVGIVLLMGILPLLKTLILILYGTIIKDNLFLKIINIIRILLKD